MGHFQTCFFLVYRYTEVNNAVQDYWYIILQGENTFFVPNTYTIPYEHRKTKRQKIYIYLGLRLPLHKKLEIEGLARNVQQTSI